MEESASPMPSSRHDTRRIFLSLLLGTVAAVFSASLLYPLFQFLWPPAAKTGGEGSVAIPLEEMRVGQSRVVPIRGEPVLLIREENKVVALSAVCTHLGCIVKWEEENKRLFCPCHAAIFDVNGNVLGGPAPRPLPSFQAKIVGDRIMVEAA